MAKRKTLGDELRIWRQVRNLTQIEAAVRLQVPLRTYQEWEQDRREPEQPGPLRQFIALDMKQQA